MILESIVTTVDRQGHVNIAPMGPTVDEPLTRFTLRPFRTSTTYENLRQTQRATIHVTDDSMLFAKAVTHQLDELPPLTSLESGEWQVLSDACRYFAVVVENWQDDEMRAIVDCRVVHEASLRPFFGFNRAKHAVIEAAILASRKHLLPATTIDQSLRELEILVEKTAGPKEQAAFNLLKDYLSKPQP